MLGLTRGGGNQNQKCELDPELPIRRGHGLEGYAIASCVGIDDVALLSCEYVPVRAPVVAENKLDAR